MNLLALALGFLWRAGRARAAITCACTATVSGLLLVAVAALEFDGGQTTAFAEVGGAVVDPGPAPIENVANLLSDPGVRPGYVFALVLICLVPLTLLQQAVRLGTASRERRLAGLRLAGATSGQVRAVAAAEVGVPALLGGLLGWPAYVIIRSLLGGSGVGRWSSDPEVVRELRLVPTSVTPAWWQVLLVAGAVSIAGLAAGAMASRNVVVSPLGVSRGGPSSPPRPWVPVALLAVGPALTLGVYPRYFDAWIGTPSALVGVACSVGGVLLIAPWVAYRVGRLVARRTASPALLLAARRLVADPRPAGRAAAATGAIALVAGGAAALLADLVSGPGNREAMYLVPTSLVFGVLLIAMVVTTFSLAVHSVESLTDRKRSLAALAAGGVPVDLLERAQRWEVGLVALPVSIAGVTMSGFGSAPFIGTGAVGMLVRVGLIAVILGCTWLALAISARAVRPWLVRALQPENLRNA